MELIDNLWRDLDRRARMGARPIDIALDPAAWAVTSYRVGRAIESLPGPLRLTLRCLHRPLAWVLEQATGIRIPPAAEIGGGLYLSHTGRISVAKGARIGRDCSLSGGASLTGEPLIGDRVSIGPGARIEGQVRVGNDAAIGANAVVKHDVDDCGAVGSVGPARIVRGRRRPDASVAVRALLREALPKPAHLLVREA